MTLVEKYRPARLGDIIGQETAVRKARALLRCGLGGRILLLVGPSGTGKTTMALAIARELGLLREGETLESVQAGGNFDLRFYRANALDQRSYDDMVVWLGLNIWNPEALCKIAVIDEAHTITAGARSGLLALEAMPAHAIVILTTSEDSEQFAPATPLGSRCKRITFDLPSDEDIAGRLAEIAFAETGNGADIPYRQIVRQGDGNVRACISELDDYLAEKGASEAA